MNKSVILLIVVLLALGGVLAMNIDNGDHWKNTSRPSEMRMPTKKVPNDKVILVRKASYDDLKQVITEFCNNYNQRRAPLVVELKKLSFNEYAIVFPYNVQFNTFLYFLYNIYYPKNVMYTPEIATWATAPAGDPWIAPELANKKLLIYIPQGEQTKTVYMTAQDGSAWQMGFAFKAQNQKLDQAPVAFRAPDSILNNLPDAPGEQIF